MAIVMGTVAVVLCLVCFCLISGGGGGLLKFNESGSDLDLSPNKLISLFFTCMSCFVIQIIFLAGLFFAAKKSM